MDVLTHKEMIRGKEYSFNWHHGRSDDTDKKNGAIKKFLYDSVDNGAEWLDSISEDWFNRISLEHLEMSSGNYCICGQLFMSDLIYKVIDEDTLQNAINSYDDTGYLRIQKALGQDFCIDHGFLVDEDEPANNLGEFVDEDSNDYYWDEELDEYVYSDETNIVWSSSSKETYSFLAECWAEEIALRQFQNLQIIRESK